MNKPKRKIVKVNATAYAHLIRAMVDGVHTCEELAEISGLHIVTVYQYCRALHEAGAIHITAYDKDCRGRDIIKIYKLGPGKDAKRSVVPATQRSAAYRAKKRQQAILHALVMPLAA